MVGSSSTHGRGSLLTNGETEAQNNVAAELESGPRAPAFPWLAGRLLSPTRVQLCHIQSF